MINCDITISMILPPESMIVSPANCPALVRHVMEIEWEVRAENLLKRWKNWKRIKQWATSRSLKVFAYDTNKCLRNTN